MKIRMKIIGPLIYEAGFSEKEMEVAPGTTADALMDVIRVSKDRPKIITRNGKAVAPNEILEEGDKVVVSPIYSGG
jgi:sulfur carrier protein ThiS